MQSLWCLAGNQYNILILSKRNYNTTIEAIVIVLPQYLHTTKEQLLQRYNISITPLLQQSLYYHSTISKPLYNNHNNCIIQFQQQQNNILNTSIVKAIHKYKRGTTPLQQQLHNIMEQLQQHSNTTIVIVLKQ